MNTLSAEPRITYPYPGLRRRILTHTPASTLAEHHMDAGSIFPLHSHPHEQTVYILEGELLMEWREGEQVKSRRAKAGEYWVVPGDIPHRVTAITACHVLDFFTPCREDYAPDR